MVVYFLLGLALGVTCGFLLWGGRAPILPSETEGERYWHHHADELARKLAEVYADLQATRW